MDRLRQLELSRCVEEWDHVLAKSQHVPHIKTSIKTHSSVALKNSPDKNSSKPASKTDIQKKHCDDQVNAYKE